MTALDDLIAQTSTALANLNKAESIRTSTAKRFSPSGSFQASFNALTEKLSILQSAKNEETKQQFTKDVQDLIQPEPQNIEISHNQIITEQVKENNNSLIPLLLVGAALFVL